MFRDKLGRFTKTKKKIEEPDWHSIESIRKTYINIIYAVNSLLEEKKKEFDPCAWHRNMGYQKTFHCIYCCSQCVGGSHLS